MSDARLLDGLLNFKLSSFHDLLFLKIYYFTIYSIHAVELCLSSFQLWDLYVHTIVVVNVFSLAICYTVYAILYRSIL